MCRTQTVWHVAARCPVGKGAGKVRCCDRLGIRAMARAMARAKLQAPVAGDCLWEGHVHSML